MMMASAPTLYEHYTSGGLTGGLSTNQSYFTLNNKNITLYSGAMHYFRVPRPYWRDRLRKMRAAGLNTVETYIPWNLHEPEEGNFDFGSGGSDMEDFLHVESFIKMAREEDLLVIVRPGPFICAEWEFGGLPSWLLKEKNIKVRTSDEAFMGHVRRYFSALLPLLAALQFMNGGPIVAFQVENEYGSTTSKTFKPDKNYLKQLRDIFLENGITELLFTSDSPVSYADLGTLPDLFQTANFARGATQQFDALKQFQKGKPSMAMEFWTGWFDHWAENHHQRNNTEFGQVLGEILEYPASVNFYMFTGGTNFGFMNGANVDSENIYEPTVTSYDYDAPIAENGDLTEKYHIVKNLIKATLKVPQVPDPIDRVAYAPITIQEQVSYEDIVQQLDFVYSEEVVPMEVLNQSYGSVLYRTKVDIPENGSLLIKGRIHDSALVLVNGQLISPALQKSEDLNGFGYWRLQDGTIKLPKSPNATLDLLITNWGRVNFGKLEVFKESKGLSKGVYLNGQKLTKWEIRSLAFGKKWIGNVQNWKRAQPGNCTLNKAYLNITEKAADTYIDVSKWNTGIVIVNDFVLGRYMHLGPQQALYLPAPLLRKGSNEIIIFEYFQSKRNVSFSKNMIYSTK